MHDDLGPVAFAEARGDALASTRRDAEAARAYAQAVAGIDALADDQRARQQWRRLQLRGAEAAAWARAARADLAGAALDDAERGLQQLPTGAATRSAAKAAAQALQVQRAQWHLQARRPEAALPLLEALRMRSSDTRRGQVLMLLGIGAGMQGDIDAALRDQAEAQQQLERLAGPEAARHRLLNRMNRAVNLWKRGSHDEALTEAELAMATIRGQFSTGQAGSPWDLARNCLNLGGIQTSRGDHAAADAAYAEALQTLDRALRAHAAGTAQGPLRATRAMALMNRGYARWRAGDAAAALDWLRRADRAAARLPALTDDRARIGVNIAHVLAAAGDHAAARRRYLRARRSFAAGLAEGAEHLRFDHANASLGLARCAWALGRASEAMAAFEMASAALVELTTRGQLQHGRTWLQGLLDQIDAGLQWPARSARSALAFQSTLARVLARAPRQSAADLSAGIAELRQAVERAAAWRSRIAALPRHAVRAATEAEAGGLRLLLRILAVLLEEGAPEALHREGAALAALVRALCDVLRECPEPGPLAFEWFLRTRGLRAQRSAIAVGDAPGLAGLRAALSALRQLEEELLGEGLPAAQAPTAQGRHATLALPAGGWPVPAAPRLARWQALRSDVEQRRDDLVRRGVLPAALRLEVDAVQARLGPAQALLLLARVGPDQLMSIGVTARDGPALQLTRLHAETAQFDAAALNMALRAALGAEAQARGLRHGASAARRAGARDALPFDRVAAWALSVYGAQFDAAIRPGLDALLAQGAQDIAVIPSDDLHLLPLAELLETRLPRQTVWSVHPGVGAWAMARPAARQALCWALMADAALDGPAALPWVLIERRLAEALWRGGDRLQPVTPAAPDVDGVNALLCIGHGATANHNRARAGLLVTPGRVLDAHVLARVHHARHMLLSCCALGRVDDVHGEGLGFLASSFAYATRWGCGWLIDVPDAEACLFSSALQYALRDADAQGPVDWQAVFRQVRRGIGAGAWPDGFGAWLGEALPGALARSVLAPGPWTSRHELLRDFDGGYAATPPPSLRQLMPWVTALGH